MNGAVDPGNDQKNEQNSKNDKTNKTNKTNNNNNSSGLKLKLIIAAAVLVLIIVLLIVLLPKCGASKKPGPGKPGGTGIAPANSGDPAQNEPGDGTHFHTFGKWTELAQPDCTNPGRRERTCTECGFVQSQNTSPLGHDGHNNECVRCGKKADIEHLAISEYANGDGLWITNGRELDAADVLIPDVIDGVPVVCIAADAFNGNEAIISVSLPDSVTQLGTFCFDYCPNLKAVRFGRNIRNQYTTVINGCPNVEYLCVEPGNPSLHSDGNCVIETETKTLILGCGNSVIPDDGSVLSLGTYSFQGCFSVKSMTVPAPVNTLYTNAFYHCVNLESILIADSVTSIESGALSKCTSLRSVRLPAHLKKLEDSLFEYCSALEEITIPKEVEELNFSCFESCTALKTVHIPRSVTRINNYVFKYCSALETVYFGGTKEQWNAVKRGDSNKSLEDAKIVYEH